MEEDFTQFETQAHPSFFKHRKPILRGI